MDTTHKEIIIWALRNATVMEQLGATLGLSDEELTGVLEDLVNKQHRTGFLFGQDGSAFSVHSFDTEAEYSAYTAGLGDMNGWLKARDLDKDEIDFLEACNPCCKECETKDPRKFMVAFENWLERADFEDFAPERRTLGLVLDLCDSCLDAKNSPLNKRHCYTAVCTQYDEAEDGSLDFIPCLVTEGESGYVPMRGQGECATPWYWGKTYRECQDICDDYNKKHYGLTLREAAIIVAGTMRKDGE